MLLLFVVLLPGFFCQTMNGYDTMLFGGLLNNKEYFLKHFHGENKGIWAGLITSMYQIGGVCALPFVGPCIDQWGRRPGMFIGSFLIIIGTIVQGLTSANASEGQMMGGRFVLGFGVSIAAAAGPIWIVETAHPKYRSVMTGLCNTTWLAGSILSSGITRGGLDIKSNNSWLIPIWFQMVFPGLICIFAFLLPESPRWLYAQGKRESAVSLLTKWHGDGNRESAWVKLQLTEYEEYLELDGSVSTFLPATVVWCGKNSQADMWATTGQTLLGLPRAVQQAIQHHSHFCGMLVLGIYSMYVVFLISIPLLSRVSPMRYTLFSLLTLFSGCGNGVLSYFMAAVLDTAGVNSSIGKANVSLGYSVEQFVCAVIGAHFVEKIGRRKMMLCGFFGVSVVWVCMTASAGTLASSLVSGNVNDSDAVFTNKNAGNAVLAFIFVFGAVYSFNITPLQVCTFVPSRIHLLWCVGRAGTILIYETPRPSTRSNASRSRSAPREWHFRASSSTPPVF